MKINIQEKTDFKVSNTPAKQKLTAEEINLVVQVINANDDEAKQLTAAAIVTANENTEAKFQAVATGIDNAGPTDTPAQSIRTYNANEGGTYTNFSGIVVSEGELSANLVQLRKTGDTWVKVLIPIPVAGLIRDADLRFNNMGALDFSPSIVTGKALTSGGAEVTAANYVIVSRLPIESATEYTIDGIVPVDNDKFMCQYNASGVVIAGTNVEMETFPVTFTSHATAKYISFALKSDSEGDNSSIEHAVIYQEVDSDVVKAISGLKQYRFSDSDLTSRFEKLKIDSIYVGAFNQQSIAIISSGGKVGAAGFVSAINVPVESGVTYELGGVRPSLVNNKFFVQYGASGEVLQSNAINKIPLVVTMALNVKFVCFTVIDDQEADTYGTENVYFGKATVTQAGTPDLLRGNKLVTFGNSIDWYDGKAFGAEHIEEANIAVGYQTHVRARLGCVVDNQGQNGKTLPEVRTAILAYNYAGVKMVTITEGANSHRKGVLPGSIAAIGGVFDTSTFAGALQSSIEYILTQNNAIKIVLITPVRGYYYQNGTVDVPSLYNGETTISKAYVDVIKQVGELYSLPVCDWYNNTAVNEKTITLYLGDKPGQPYSLHPTNAQYRIMANQLIPVLEKA